MIDLLNILPWALALLLLALACLQRWLIKGKDDVIEAKNEHVNALEDLVGAQVTRIEILSKMACCGCGHPLRRHDDPDSLDGFGCRDCNCQAIHSLLDEMSKDRRVAERDSP